MSISESNRRGIEDSVIFVCIIPDGGLKEQTEGYQCLLYAAGLGRPILYYLPGDRNEAIPPFPGVTVRGDPKNVYEAIKQFLELKPGDEVKAIDGGWEVV